MPADRPPTGDRLPRRRFPAGAGAVALTIPPAAQLAAAGTAPASPVGKGQPGGSRFPPVPGPDTTTAEDRQQMARRIWALR